MRSGFVWNANVNNSQRVSACRAVSILVFCCPESFWTACTSDPLPVLSVPQHESGPHQYGQHVFCSCVCERVVLIALCMWTSLSGKPLMNCVLLCACQWPRGTAGPRNYLNGRSCISTAEQAGLRPGEQGNDQSGRRNALILSHWREGMLPLSDGLIAPIPKDRQLGPLGSG